LTRVLALDTSTWLGGLALVEREGTDEPRVVAELVLDVRDSHADQMLRRAALLLDEAGWVRSSLDLYAATRGPGSFTGIRVGLGTVRGLSLATGRPAVCETTLRALAEAYGPAEAERLTLMEAGRAELYGARFDARSSPPAVLEEPWLAPRTQVASMRSAPPPVVVPGPGTQVEPAGLPAGARLVRPQRSVAAALGRLALSGDPEATKPGDLAPLYIRPPDAILKRGRS